jgi:pimeloyl-ACP methyl ester carboxylesterase
MGNADNNTASRDTEAPAKDAPYPMRLAGQDAWIYDKKFHAGYFHTFDRICIGNGAQKEPRKIHVFLPRSYTNTQKRYPVVYMNDGDTAFFEGGPANKTWDVAGVLAEGYAGGAFEEVIVVAICPLDRDGEYTHVHWLVNRQCCGLPAYASYIADAVKPFIDGAYRTRPGASDTTIVGSSHGGLASFYIAANRGDVFGKAIAMSPSFWAGLDNVELVGILFGAVPQAVGLLNEVAVGRPLSGSALMRAVDAGLRTWRPRLYLDWGLVRTGGMHNSVIEERAAKRGNEMTSLLISSFGYVKNTSLFTVEDPHGEHEERSWGRRLGYALGVVLPP